MMAQTQMLQEALAKQAQESRDREERMLKEAREDRERAETKAREERERAETKAREDRERLEAQLREERERAEERFATLLAKQTGTVPAQNGLAPSEHEAKGRCIRILEKAEEDDRVATLDELKEECKKVDVFNTGMVGLSGQVASMNINAVNTRKPKRARQFRKPLNRYSENSNRNYGNFRPMQQGNFAGKNFNKISSNKPSSYPKSKTLYCYGCGDASLDSDNAALKKYPELTVDLQINSRPFAKMIIDTGADETILNEDTWQKLGSPPMQNTTKNVRAYGGGKYELLGSVLLDVSMQGSPPLQLTAYVVQARISEMQQMIEDKSLMINVAQLCQGVALDSQIVAQETTKDATLCQVMKFIRTICPKKNPQGLLAPYFSRSKCVLLYRFYIQNSLNIKHLMLILAEWNLTLINTTVRSLKTSRLAPLFIYSISRIKRGTLELFTPSMEKWATGSTIISMGRDGTVMRTRSNRATAWMIPKNAPEEPMVPLSCKVRVPQINVLVCKVRSLPINMLMSKVRSYATNVLVCSDLAEMSLLSQNVSYRAMKKMLLLVRIAMLKDLHISSDRNVLVSVFCESNLL
ncbi:gag-polyprotein putative aspartyl protease domain-containing protein [Ditylenchus destructor]|uniref:Gag-polyprotein putative aspartyl protease domain-containing protein n=1 Tax=Ditylenchus destructor TaxID=166010 RepID=A0AAD4R838_9BILA|nr:gag-polyprotein putative aspartyl protease domain-containing protein [Ditylenchus destructor]